MPVGQERPEIAGKRRYQQTIVSHECINSQQKSMKIHALQVDPNPHSEITPAYMIMAFPILFLMVQVTSIRHDYERWILENIFNTRFASGVSWRKWKRRIGEHG